MYEISKDYINKLIAKSGVKLGTAKQAAMVAIIELLDENSLEWLIKSIRADYESMKFELSRKDQLLETIKDEISKRILQTKLWNMRLSKNAIPSKRLISKSST